MKSKVLKSILYLCIVIIFVIGIALFIKNFGPRLLWKFIIWLGEDQI